MKQVHRSVLLWFSAQEMFDLVADVDHYPQFLPWCNQAQVLERHVDGLTARLGLSYSGIKQSFTTRNTHVHGQSIHVSLVDGPFSLLEGHWTFQGLSSPQPGRSACKVELDLRYAFSSRALELVVSPVFDKVASTLVESFVQRAESVLKSS